MLNSKNSVKQLESANSFAEIKDKLMKEISKYKLRRRIKIDKSKYVEMME